MCRWCKARGAGKRGQSWHGTSYRDRNSNLVFPSFVPPSMSYLTIGTAPSQDAQSRESNHPCARSELLIVMIEQQSPLIGCSSLATRQGVPDGVLSFPRHLKPPWKTKAQLRPITARGWLHNQMNCQTRARTCKGFNLRFCPSWSLAATRVSGRDAPST